MEFDTEVHINEDFSTWTLEDRLELIGVIAEGGDWEFIGEDTVSIEPPDYP